MPRMPSIMTPLANSAEVGEIVVATQRWLERAVIGLNLRPFAKAVHVKKQIRYAVTAAQTADELLAELAHELQVLAETDPEVIDTTLLIHLQAMGEFLDFHFFLAEANAAIRNLGFEGVFQIASLHPRFQSSTFPRPSLICPRFTLLSSRRFCEP